MQISTQQDVEFQDRQYIFSNNTSLLLLSHNIEIVLIQHRNEDPLICKDIRLSHFPILKVCDLLLC